MRRADDEFKWRSRIKMGGTGGVAITIIGPTARVFGASRRLQQIIRFEEAVLESDRMVALSGFQIGAQSRVSATEVEASACGRCWARNA